MTYKKIEAQYARIQRKFLRKLAGWNFPELRNQETAEPQLRYGKRWKVPYVVSFGPKEYKKNFKIQNRTIFKPWVTYFCEIFEQLRKYSLIRTSEIIKKKIRK